VRRREFIAALGGVAAWPVMARAQQHRARRVVIASGLAESDPREQAQLEVFRDGLRKLGWTDGQDRRIETLWSAASPERAKAYVAQLVGMSVIECFETDGGVNYRSFRLI
jgi:putative tryptophan/tyrosine transport system substrate-binding protein